MKKAFTLIELLVVIAIIAILAAILFPVFAQAKASAKKAAGVSNLKQVSLGLLMYSTDYDDRAPYFYGTGTAADPNQYHNTDTWVGQVFPYIKNRSIFFDPTIAEPKGDIKDANGDLYTDCYYHNCPGTASQTYTYRWQWVTNFSINSDGFAEGGTGTCESATRFNQTRSLTAIESNADRLMVSPTQYGTLPFSWMYFRSYEASWPYIDEYYDGFSWNNLVWDARKRWGGRFTGAYADGHAGKFGREKFVGYSRIGGVSDATNRAAYCQARRDRDLDKFWGPFWSGN
ncbi:MAG: prepilin-type N-terminal cleavage/methylation domain-containing protein [Fimbriimonas sp.]